MPARPFPVSWSMPDMEALAGRLSIAYDLKEAHCQLLAIAMRDVFLVSAAGRRYIFYLYHSGSRSPAEIEGEWRFVNYLAQEGLPVIPALLTRDGEWLLTLVTPEGRRYGVLTRYEAADHFRRRPGLPAARAYGRVIAQLHEITNYLGDDFGRAPVDTRRQITDAVRTFAQAFPDRPGDLAMIHESVQKLQSRIPTGAEDPPFYGMIHGDVIRANALVSADGQRVTLIDFDLCGPGPRIYDVASFFVTLYGMDDEREMRAAFLEGYISVRLLKRPELESLPLYEAIRAVFTIGVPAENINTWGRAIVEPAVDEGLARLKTYIGRLGEQ